MPDQDGRGPLPPLRDLTRIKQPSTVGGVVYLVLLTLALAGVVIAALGPWRTGVSWLGATLVAGAAVRLALPERKAGMLGVRLKALDAFMLSAVGVVLILLAVTIPDQS